MAVFRYTFCERFVLDGCVQYVSDEEVFESVVISDLKNLRTSLLLVGEGQDEVFVVEAMYFVLKLIQQ